MTSASCYINLHGEPVIILTSNFWPESGFVSVKSSRSDLVAAQRRWCYNVRYAKTPLPEVPYPIASELPHLQDSDRPQFSIECAVGVGSLLQRFAPGKF